MVIPGKPPFDFNSLSDGFASMISIVTEILMRSRFTYDAYKIPGIVLIDEIETHLHISLQKNILPFLTELFPNIQFIVSTHSPFIINSTSNTIVFDLERQLRLDDPSQYSMEGIVEGYFDQDKYSEELKTRLNEFDFLSLKEGKNDVEISRLRELKDYFDEVPTSFSPELSLKIKEIRLNNILNQ
jgi:AAA15 family ATPase/GTPase